MNIPYEFSFDTLISPKFMFNILLCEQSYLNYCDKIFLPVEVLSTTVSTYPIKIKIKIKNTRTEILKSIARMCDSTAEKYVNELYPKY